MELNPQYFLRELKWMLSKLIRHLLAGSILLIIGVSLSLIIDNIVLANKLFDKGYRYVFQASLGEQVMAFSFICFTAYAIFASLNILIHQRICYLLQLIFSLFSYFTAFAATLSFPDPNYAGGVKALCLFSLLVIIMPLIYTRIFRKSLFKRNRY